MTQTTYNQQGHETTIIRGDVADPDQSHLSLLRDGLNRSTGKVNDPDGLKLQTKKLLDLTDKTIADIDPNGNHQWHFYDASGHKIFTIDAEGGIKQWCYDTESHCTTSFIYEKSLPPETVKKIDVKTSLDQISSWVLPFRDSNDTIIYFFYDDLGRERFQVTGKGAVTEKRYDKASREIQRIRYATRLDLPITDFNDTEIFAAWMEHTKSAEDRITYFIKDANNRDRYIIDPKGYIVEQCYDVKGNEITSIAYATQLPANVDPNILTQLPIEQVRAKLIELALIKPAEDRITYKIYDVFDRLCSIINADSAITRFDFDENGNQVTVSKFEERARSIQIDPNIHFFTDYDQLVTEVTNRQPDPINKKDRLTKASYDATNRKIRTTIYLKDQEYQDVFERDSLGNIRSHTDKANNVWTQELDRAERVINTTSPTTNISEGIPNPDGSNNFILPIVATQIKCCTEYDQAGNEKVFTQGIAEGVEWNQPRTLCCEYNGYNNIKKKTIPQTAINDPEQNAQSSIRTRPEKKIDLAETTTWNGKQKPILVKNFAGYLTFNVYDAEGNLYFEVQQTDPDPDHPELNRWRVTEYETNAFGESTKITKYANPIYFQGDQYANGLAKDFVKEKTKFCPEDQIKNYKWDKRGDITLIEEGPVLSYSPILNAPPQVKLAVKQIKKETNAFREEVYKAHRLIDAASGSDLWAEAITWRDKNGQIAATSNPLQFITRFQRNAFGEEEKRKEYTNSLPGEAKQLMGSLAALDKELITIPHPKDRKFATERDQLGNPIKLTRVGVIRQKVTFDDKNIPGITDLSPQDISQSCTYNAMGKTTSTTDENGAIRYFYWNERGLKIAETGAPRIADHRTGITIIPLTFYYYNAAGQYAGQSDYINGAVQADINTFPKVKKPDEQDQLQDRNP